MKVTTVACSIEKTKSDYTCAYSVSEYGEPVMFLSAVCLLPTAGRVGAVTPTLTVRPRGMTCRNSAEAREPKGPSLGPFPTYRM